MAGSPADRSAVVVFTNGYNGMAIMPDVINQLMPGNHPAFIWLNYARNANMSAWLDWLQTSWIHWFK